VGLWVTKFLKNISPAVFIGHLADLKRIEITPGRISIGAGVTYTEFEPFVLAHFPEALDYWRRIGGWQVRNAGTIGGNVANGSPIGETPPLLIALGATMTLRSAEGTREIPVEDYFIAYGKQDRRPGEFVETIHVPLKGEARIAAYKVSKRHHADITASAAAFRVVTEGATIIDARVAVGGRAATPKRATRAEAALKGQPFAAETFEAAALAVADDFQPLSDWRASAEYRQQLAANFFRRFWLEQSGAEHRLRRVE